MPLLGQRDDPRLVAAQGQPLEEQGVDLALQFAGGPAGVDRLGLVERPGGGIIDAEQEPVMGPGQFATQCVTNRVGHEKRPHIAEVGRVIALAELGLEPLGEPLQDPLSVTGPLLSGLLVFDDDAADFPVGVDHDGVDRLPGAVPGRGEDLADLPMECVEAVIGGRPLRGLGTARERRGRRFLGMVTFLCHATDIASPRPLGEWFCPNCSLEALYDLIRTPCQMASARVEATRLRPIPLN